MDGMNVADWIDPEIMLKLRQLEREEEGRLEDEETEMAEEVKEKARHICILHSFDVVSLTYC